MSEYIVKIDWTKYFDPIGISEHLHKKDVLYLLGTYDMSLFIGIAEGTDTVGDRIKIHMEEPEGPVQWIEEHKDEMWYPWDVKVGTPDLEKHDEGRLRDVMSLLTQKEHKRGGCLAQEGPDRKKSSSYFPRLIVINEGDYPPLLNEYFEDTRVFTQKLQPYVLPDEVQ